MSKLQRLFMWIGIAVTAAAVIQELRKPSEARDWHGKVAGFVPYEFRAPTAERVKQTYWDADDDRVFTPTAFGVGWGLNVARVAKIATSARTSA
jgi:uncharacterized protein DUF5808